MGIVAGWGRLSEGGQLPSILQYVSIFRLHKSVLPVQSHFNILFVVFLSFTFNFQIICTVKLLSEQPRATFGKLIIVKSLFIFREGHKYERQIKLWPFQKI